MATEIRLPKIGFSMEEGRLVEWLVEDGAEVSQGQPLYALEMDKSVQEVEAPTSGVIQLKAAPDEDYEVGALLATIE